MKNKLIREPTALKIKKKFGMSLIELITLFVTFVIEILQHTTFKCINP